MKTLIILAQFLILLLLPKIVAGQEEQIRLYLPGDTELPEGGISALACDKDNKLWIGITTGVMSYDGSDFKNYDKNQTAFFKGLMYSTSTLDTDEKGSLWIGSSMGIIKFDGDNWTNFNKDNSELPGNGISSLLIDKENTAWIGAGKGLIKYKDNTWKIYDKKTTEFPSRIINDIEQDLDGTLWIATNLEIVHFNPADGTFKVHNKKSDGLPGDTGGFLTVIDIEIDSAGTKWFGTTSGLIKYDGNSWKVFNEENSPIPSSKITAVSIDKKGNIWVGCGGLYRYSDPIQDEKQIYARYLGSGKPIINPDGYIVIDGSQLSIIKGGLARFNGKDWKIFTPSKGLPDYYPKMIIMDGEIFINCITSDGNGNTWVGTAYNGLVRISNMQ